MSEGHKTASGLRWKEFHWQDCIVRITKKKVKNANLRIRPEEPQVIRISIPHAMTYDAGMKLLEQPRIRRWIEKYQKKVNEPPAQPRMQNADRMEHVAYYRKRLRELLPGLIRKWEPVLGVRCNKVSIRDTRSQWGSCSIQTRNISISVWLGAFPEECVEYVVVHELTHLLESGHNERFYGLLDQYYPNWRSCREQLKHGVT